MLAETEQFLAEIKTLQTVGQAGTYESGWTDGLAGMRSVSIFADFDYGAGGEDVVMTVETAFGKGLKPVPIACWRFEKAPGLFLCNLTADLGRNWFEARALKPGEIADGILGDRLRYRLQVKGMYERTSLKLYFAPR